MSVIAERSDEAISSIGKLEDWLIGELIYRSIGELGIGELKNLKNDNFFTILSKNF